MREPRKSIIKLTKHQIKNLRLFFYNSAFILALSLLLDNRFCYSLYKTVWWTLITSCYKELTDSFTKWSTLYHLWLIVLYSLYFMQLSKDIKTIKRFKALKLIVHAFRINLRIRHFALYGLYILYFQLQLVL